MSLTFSRYVRFIFHVCPVLALRVISLHLPSCRLVSLCFVSLSFPPALPLFSCLSLSRPFQFPFVSLSFPVAFLSCRLLISSPHFLALPCISPLLPSISRKKARFSSILARRTSKNTEFSQISCKRRQEAQASKRAGRGNRAWDPCFATAPQRLRLVERHEIAARYVGAGPPLRIRCPVRGYPLSSSKYPTRRTMSADIFSEILFTSRAGGASGRKLRTNTYSYVSLCFSSSLSLPLPLSLSLFCHCLCLCLCLSLSLSLFHSLSFFFTSVSFSLSFSFSSFSVSFFHALSLFHSLSFFFTSVSFSLSFSFFPRSLFLFLSFSFSLSYFLFSSFYILSFPLVDLFVYLINVPTLCIHLSIFY